jgi:hypothetical protein
MASIEARNRGSAPTRWRVIWREGTAKHSETFLDEAEARNFGRLVEASGNSTPRGWTPGFGFPGDFTPPPMPPPVEGEPSMATTDFVLGSAARRVKASEGTRRTYREMVDRYISGTVRGDERDGFAHPEGFWCGWPRLRGGVRFDASWVRWSQRRLAD